MNTDLHGLFCRICSLLWFITVVDFRILTFYRTKILCSSNVYAKTGHTVNLLQNRKVTEELIFVNS